MTSMVDSEKLDNLPVSDSQQSPKDNEMIEFFFGDANTPDSSGNPSGGSRVEIEEELSKTRAACNARTMKITAFAIILFGLLSLPFVNGFIAKIPRCDGDYQVWGVKIALVVVLIAIVSYFLKA